MLVGLYIIIGRFYYDAWWRAATYYGLTSQRVLLLRTSWPEETMSLSFSDLGQIECSRQASGEGTIFFRKQYGAWDALNIQRSPNARAFFQIAQVNAVYQQLLAARDRFQAAKIP